MSHVVRRIALPLASLLVVGALAAVPAGSAPTWTSPSVPLSLTGANTASQEVAVNDAGVAVAIWRSGYESPSRAVIQASIHPVGGSWSAPDDLSASEGFGAEPEVAIDAAGNAVAVWQQTDAPNPFIEASSRPAGGSWSEPVPISDPSKGAFVPKVAIDDAGNAVAIWNSDNSVQWSRRPVGGAWSSPLPFDSTLSTDEVGNALTLSPGGEAIAVWTDLVGGHEVVTFARRPAGGSWTTPDDLSATTEDASSVDVSSSASGKALITWILFDSDTPDPGDRYLVQARVRPDATSTFGNVADLSQPSGDATFARAAMDDLGRASVIWHTTVAGKGVIKTARYTIDDAWTGRVDVSASGVDANVPDIGIAGMGDVTVVWRAEDDNILQTARRPIGLTSWGAPQDLTDGVKAPIDPRVAGDAVGNFVTVWSAVDSGTGAAEVRARAFDNVGPVVASITIPKQGQAEKASTFSVDAKDAWSPFSVVWTFGDGKQATGLTVQHTYAKSGLYKVFMTATDAVGNVTKKGGSIFAGPPLPRLSGVLLTKPAIHVVGSRLLPRATVLKLSLNTKALLVVKLKRTTKLRGHNVSALMTTQGVQGRQSIRLTSRVGFKLLPPGTYRVKVTARNPVGTSLAKVLKLKILR